MKETFLNARKDNNLSSELNKNIEKYIIYRKIYENFPKVIQNIKNNFKHLYKELNSIYKIPLNSTNFFEKKRNRRFYARNEFKRNRRTKNN